MNTYIKVFAILIVVLLQSQWVTAQKITIEGFGGWLWTGKAGYNGSIRVDDKGNYGVRAGVNVPGLVIEFEWNHTDTRLHYYDAFLRIDEASDVQMNYYMLGIQREVSPEPTVLFGLFNIGLMNMKGKDVSFSENWFTVGIGGGLKHYLADNFALRLQARLLLPMQFAGVGFGCGTGGCGTSVGTYTSTLQGDFTAGIVVRFGD